MTGVLYLLALIAVAWLVAWTIRDPARPTDVWWPFDMQGDETPAGPRDGSSVPGGWRERGGGGTSWRAAIRKSLPADLEQERRDTRFGSGTREAELAIRSASRQRYRVSDSRPPAGPAIPR